MLFHFVSVDLMEFSDISRGKGIWLWRLNQCFSAICFIWCLYMGLDLLASLHMWVIMSWQLSMGVVLLIPLRNWLGMGATSPARFYWSCPLHNSSTLSWGIVGFTGIPLDKRVSLFPSQIIFQCVHRTVLK